MTYQDNDKIAFEKFAASGYDANSVPIDDIPRVTNFWRHYIIVPVYPRATWEQQESRRKQWPDVFGWFVGRIYGELIRERAETTRLKQELIEAKKELSKLKRSK